MVLLCEAAAREKTPGAGNLHRTEAIRRFDENALVRAAKNGETKAFDELWQSHARKLLRMTYRITGNYEDAGDALQGALLSAFVHIRRFDGRASFSTWLTRIAVNAALQIIRQNGSSPQVSLDDAQHAIGQTAYQTLRARGPDPEAYCSQREREATLAKAIGRLPPPLRKALVLQILEERSSKETAEIMGISVSAAKARVFRARAMLTSQLAPPTR